MDSRENTEEASTESSHDSIAKKATLLYVFKVLKERTNDDRDEYLNYKQISEILKNEYHVKQGRKAVSDNIDIIKDFFDRNPEFKYKIVIREPAGTGVALASDRKELEDSQRIFLIHSVYSSKAFNAQYAQEIVDYLVDGQSDYFRKRYGNNNNLDELARNGNSDFFLNIEIINEAIERKKKIKFKYYIYDESGNLVPKREKPYMPTPRYLVSANGTYYVLCDYKTFENIVTYKVNQMKDIEIMDADGIPDEKSTHFGPKFNLEQWQNEHFYMYGGDSIDAKMKIKENNQNALTYIFERFGRNANVSRDENNDYIIKVTVNEDSLYYWVLQYIEDIEVLEPQNIRDRLKETCQKALKKYGIPTDPEPVEENPAE